MGYLDYLRHGSKMFSKKGAMPAYMVYFIADACNAKCKHCLLADGAHPGWETPSMQFKKQELSLEEVEGLLVQKAMARYSGNVSEAARALGLSRAALYRRLEKHRI